MGLNNLCNLWSLAEVLVVVWERFCGSGSGFCGVLMSWQKWVWDAVIWDFELQWKGWVSEKWEEQRKERESWWRNLKKERKFCIFIFSMRERERERENVMNLTEVFFKSVMDRCLSNILTHIPICRKCCKNKFAANTYPLFN